MWIQELWLFTMVHDQVIFFLCFLFWKKYYLGFKFFFVLNVQHLMINIINVVLLHIHPISISIAHTLIFSLGNIYVYIVVHHKQKMKKPRKDNRLPHRGRRWCQSYGTYEYPFFILLSKFKATKRIISNKRPLAKPYCNNPKFHKILNFLKWHKMS